MSFSANAVRLQKFGEKCSKYYTQEGAAKIMKRDEIRQKLIDGTIHVIAEGGLDKATTKQIGTETAVNEAYIYRCFAGKEDLFASVYSFLDNELLDKTMECVPVMYDATIEFKQRCRTFFFGVWRFLLSNSEKCLAYVRYYYSPYFKKYSYAIHEARFKPLVEKFSIAFIEEADVWMILNHILDVMLSFSVKVHNGLMSEDDNYGEHVFRVLYESIKQYLITTQEKGA